MVYFYVKYIITYPAKKCNIFYCKYVYLHKGKYKISQ